MNFIKLVGAVTVCVLLATAALAHGNVLYDVSLDFDQGLKKGVVKASQEFLHTDEEPFSFDYDHELLIAKFDRNLELSVAVNPLDYAVFGFRDDAQLSRKVKDKINKEKARQIAEGLFDKLPSSYQTELRFDMVKDLYSGAYEFTWNRYVDNILVLNNYLKVEVDPGTGNVISWKQTVFYFPKNKFSGVPAISHEVAQKIAELRFDAAPTSKRPVLVFEKDSLIWLVKVKSLYPFYVGIDAKTGEVLFSGNPRGELPEGYDYGRAVPVEETDLIKEIIGEAT